MYRVFLVDDEPFIVEGLCDAIDWAAFGLEIVGVAGNGRQALDRLAETPTDLLITDITMPSMNGLDLIREARVILPGLKVIILSGYNEFDYLKTGMSLGIENYLLKPVNFEELQATLTTVVNKLNASGSKPLLSEEDFDILKNTILHRWMTGRIAPEELDQRARLLGLRLDKPYLTAAVLRGGRQEDNLDAALSTILGQEGTSLIFADLDGDEIILFMAESQEEGKHMALLALQQLLAALPEEHEIRISVGSTERIGQTEQRSYARAKKAQDYYLLPNRTGIMDYEQLPTIAEDTPEAFAIGGGEYSKWLLAKDKEKLFALIDETFNRFQYLDGATPELLQSIAVEMVVGFRVELKDMKGAEQSRDVLFHFKKTFDRIASASALHELTDGVKAAAHFTMEVLGRSDTSPIVRQVLGHIHQSSDEALSLKTLGQQYNIHPAYLGQLFHKETGDSFTEYINKYRIERAKELLRTTPLKVSEIARNVGYWETGYFYKQFKKHVGISPIEFKELL